MLKVAAIVLIAVAWLTLLPQRHADAQSTDVSEVVTGLVWDEIDSEYLPEGILVQAFPASGRDNEGDLKVLRMTVAFPSGRSFSVGVDSMAGSGAAIGTCSLADGSVLFPPLSGICWAWPEFRQTVLLLIVLGYHDIVYVGEFRNHPVDLDDLNITRADISAFALAAAALNPSTEEN